MSRHQKAYTSFTAFIAGCINTVISVLKVAVKSRMPSAFPKTDGEKCLVLGNGPSLSTTIKQHRAYLEKNPSLCVNTFSLAPEFTLLKPRYYVLLDPGFWLADHAHVIQTLQVLKEKTSWTLHLFVPREAKKSSLLRSLAENPNIRICYINYVVFKGFTPIAHFFYKRNRAMPQSQNVLVASLFIAINLGYKRIEMFGADHSWHENIAVNADNVVCVKQVHFYEEEARIEYLPFYKVIHSSEVFRMDELFNAWAKVFYGYQKIETYARSRGCDIYNGSERTFVDAFKRMKIQE